MEQQQAAGHHDEHPPTTIRQYIMIGVILAIITALELALTEAFDLPMGVLVGSLIFLSAIKFAIVVALFMHLRFDHQLLTRLFIFGLALASVLLLALIALFWTGHRDSLTPRTYAVAGETHGQEDGGEGAAAEGEGEPAGDPAEGLVQGMPVGEYFASNCAACHGANREGLIGPALTPDVLTDSDQVYYDTIADGRPGTAMPSWTAAGLNDADINALVQFITNVEP